jgi:hypothetical protein
MASQDSGDSAGEVDGFYDAGLRVALEACVTDPTCKGTWRLAGHEIWVRQRCFRPGKDRPWRGEEDWSHGSAFHDGRGGLELHRSRTRWMILHASDPARGVVPQPGSPREAEFDRLSAELGF